MVWQGQSLLLYSIDLVPITVLVLIAEYSKRDCSILQMTVLQDVASTFRMEK